jgi:hypothetical protein
MEEVLASAELHQGIDVDNDPEAMKKLGPTAVQVLGRLALSKEAKGACLVYTRAQAAPGLLSRWRNSIAQEQIVKELAMRILDAQPKADDSTAAPSLTMQGVSRGIHLSESPATILRICRESYRDLPITSQLAATALTLQRIHERPQSQSERRRRMQQIIDELALDDVYPAAVPLAQNAFAGARMLFAAVHADWMRQNGMPDYPSDEPLFVTGVFTVHDLDILRWKDVPEHAARLQLSQFNKGEVDKYIFMERTKRGNLVITMDEKKVPALEEARASADPIDTEQEKTYGCPALAAPGLVGRALFTLTRSIILAQQQLEGSASSSC